MQHITERRCIVLLDGTQRTVCSREALCVSQVKIMVPRYYDHRDPGFLYPSENIRQCLRIALSPAVCIIPSENKGVRLKIDHLIGHRIGKRIDTGHHRIDGCAGFL